MNLLALDGCEVCERLRETEQQSDNFPPSQLPGLTGGADDAEANKSWEISLLDQTGGYQGEMRCNRESSLESAGKFYNFVESLFKTISLLP